MAKSFQFWIGDWLNYGEMKYGEKYSQAMEITDYTLSSLEQFAWVSNRVECSNRLEHLAWTYHMVAAPLEPKEQVKWLDIAEKEEQYYKYCLSRVFVSSR